MVGGDILSKINCGHKYGQPLKKSIEELQESGSMLFKVFESHPKVPDLCWKYESEGLNVGYRISKLLWPNLFFNLKDSILLLRSISALTCHSAQGTGRDKVFLDCGDFKKASNKKALLYTGASRAKKELIILTK